MAIIKPNGTLSGRVGELVYQYQKGMLTVRQRPASLYIQILLLPLHSLTTSRKWNKADASFVVYSNFIITFALVNNIEEVE